MINLTICLVKVVTPTFSKITSNFQSSRLDNPYFLEQ